jgi:ubiquinone/menaquinone biosynthesis C-methylase UbiE
MKEGEGDMEGSRREAVPVRGITNPSGLMVLLHVYLESPITAPYYRRFVSGLGLRGDERVLVFGSGWGNESFYIARALSAGGGTLTCVDISETWIKTAQKRLREFSNVNFIRGDITAEAYRGILIGFDAAVVHFALHDVNPADRSGAAVALARALRRGGALHIKEPVKASHGVSPEEVRSLMTGAGLREESLVTSNSIIIGGTLSAVFRKE